jgi:probable biosynthetic protein (TIGR04098 family)
LPHTNANGLAEHLLLAHAGHLQWMSMARAAGVPLSAMRTLSGGEVYATFYYIEERFPAGLSTGSFQLDDDLRFVVYLRAFKNIAVEGQILFDRLSRPIAKVEAGEWARASAEHPYVRFGNIFITPERGNSALRVAPPANADFTGLPPLPNDENPYRITKPAEVSGDFGLFDPAWGSIDRADPWSVRYAIDPDRDTNGAGLVYFANYVAFMDMAEREALEQNATRPLTVDECRGRTLRHRRIAYYGNVDLDDAVLTTVNLLQSPHDEREIGVRTTSRRESDGKVICRADAIKRLPAAAT